MWQVCCQESRSCKVRLRLRGGIPTSAICCLWGLLWWWPNADEAYVLSARMASCGWKESTLLPLFPQFIIFKRPHFAISCGVISLHRKSNLPAEESGIEVVRRIGNEAQGGSEEAFAADVITEVRETRGETRGCRANSGLPCCGLDVEPDLKKIRPIGRHLARDVALSICGPSFSAREWTVSLLSPLSFTGCI